MTQVFLTKRSDLKNEDYILFTPGMRGVDISARRALTKALKSLARRLDLEDTQVVANRLAQGDQSLWNDFPL